MVYPELRGTLGTLPGLEHETTPKAAKASCAKKIGIVSAEFKQLSMVYPELQILQESPPVPLDTRSYRLQPPP